ncbi:uncharacterized protein B0H64DRAFT_243733 [Chaetomium fimeti]|uniref:Secreted protein n=1 Tax=Chaetomium fimeti TaxID=1854472 RepID=A0AAE0H8P1_9PEZI|nr:hypothetical protein B0H64DRAFT_243733 [Chaetomium fimeti]
MPRAARHWPGHLTSFRLFHLAVLASSPTLSNHGGSHNPSLACQTAPIWPKQAGQHPTTMAAHGNKLTKSSRGLEPRTRLSHSAGGSLGFIDRAGRIGRGPLCDIVYVEPWIICAVKDPSSPIPTI